MHKYAVENMQQKCMYILKCALLKYANILHSHPYSVICKYLHKARSICSNLNYMLKYKIFKNLHEKYAEICKTIM